MAQFDGWRFSKNIVLKAEADSTRMVRPPKCHTNLSVLIFERYGQPDRVNRSNSFDRYGRERRIQVIILEKRRSV